MWQFVFGQVVAVPYKEMMQWPLHLYLEFREAATLHKQLVEAEYRRIQESASWPL